MGHKKSKFGANILPTPNTLTFFGFPLCAFWSHFSCKARGLNRLFSMVFEKKILSLILKVVGCLKKNSKNFLKKLNYPKLGLWELWSLLLPSLATQNSHDVELKVYTLVFTKITTSPADLQIGYIGFLPLLHSCSWRQKTLHTQFQVQRAKLK